jgi:adenylate cyclase class 2
MLEREIKLAFDNPARARAAVVATGATPLRCRRLQEDNLFDTADETLRRRGCALRVRSESGKSLLTFKGPAQASPMKLREEHETIVSDGDELKTVFAELGFLPWFRYQKYREEFAAEDVTIAIDETPIGTFVEVEGGEAAIHAVAQALGRTSADFIVESYRTLFLARRAEYGLTGNDMVFADEIGVAP